jgi:threonine/homoserine/homoserine lactone efflux protein
MLGVHAFPVFLIAGILLNLTPGADTVFIVSRTLAEGRRAGVASALGITTGSLVYTTATAFGLTALLAASPTAFTAIRIAGAFYLAWIGLRMMRLRPLSVAGSSARTVDASWRRTYRQGMLTNLLNPKVGLFYLAFLPQFVTPTRAGSPIPYLVLGATFSTTGALWCLVLVRLADRMRQLFADRPRAVARVQRCAGAAIALLGVRLAFQRS